MTARVGGDDGEEIGTRPRWPSFPRTPELWVRRAARERTALAGRILAQGSSESNSAAVTGRTRTSTASQTTLEKGMRSSITTIMPIGAM